MRKQFYFRYCFVLFITVIILNACQKEVSKDIASSNKEIIAKVNSWLDSQRPATQPNKSNNVQLLKDNLDFSKLRYEQRSQNDQFLIIPVKENFKTLKSIDKNIIPELILIIDKSGNIKQGDVVLYIPDVGQTIIKIPDNTFNKIYSNKPLDYSGMFRFLSVTGRWLYQLGYKNGKLHSLGLIQAGTRATNISNNEMARTNTTCFDWYLVITYYYSDGSTYQTREYVGTTCDGCDNQDYQSLCPDDGGGNGGDETCDSQISGTSINEKKPVQSGSDDGTTRTRFYSWNIFMVSSALTTAYLESKETGVQEKGQDNIWRFQTLTHTGIISTGVIIGWSLTAENVSALTHILAHLGVEGQIGTIDLNFNARISLVCKGFPIGKTYTGITNSTGWYVNE